MIFSSNIKGSSFRGLLLLLLLALQPAMAMTLEGDYVQGGMLIGQVEPGSQVSVNGKSVKVSKTGEFLVGFDRDAPLQYKLVVSRDGEPRQTRQFTIKAREYQIQRIDGLPPSKVTPPERNWERIKKEVALVKQARELNEDRTDFLNGFIWPSKGVISGVFGSQRILNGKPRRPHYGVDVAAPVGTLVVAPAAGVVTLAHSDMFYSGGTLIIDHGLQLSSSFLHLNKILVQEGQVVKQGDPIAEIGATGRVTGPHLDWRMNLRAARIDPQLLVPPMPE
ncbi:MAG: M23 family metallopeptidase [Candidatus Thiodiazotropha lotti]|uniref:Peptidase M23 n=1 Tax=Candidatus Thiodiazotropha endoloripes TaxID=1818881 RepID=A0A1E2UU24_9GAMM|nr:M23 family metallopeptidase [Candidatus Thiodiazotropha endoloripes]MCG7897074.1 M23 family metallopeptidase [Candidatus Thiodiazotropha weberae]MCG7991150.1 M23 family metallopeptidase [Candidatus Thiodiazotropha lotti]MCG7902963.1 M23 family metallopeptidase [Candidatus Thiodiazotropha weberae]MCG7915021.1 M23 family metallopeptidase [Candidatus Thiodiazotropha weberae]MCG8001360.1 M23 family metallopeptidase [Candidatus Thiodiazotropha lotti]